MRDILLNTIHIARTDRGITQEELAQIVGVTRQTIIAMEKGNYTPSVSLALKLAAYFKMPVERLFSLKE